jgi:hypothetical protein
MLDSLEKKGKNAEQLDTCSAQSTAELFSDVTFHIQNFMGNRSWLVVMSIFARCCSCWGPWFQTGGKTVKNSYVPGSRSDISARCGPFNANYFFQIYRGVSGRIGSFGCRFLVVPEVLIIEMWETLEKVEKQHVVPGQYVAAWILSILIFFWMSCMCINKMDTWLAGTYPYLTEKKIGVDMRKCANLGWIYEPKVAPVDLELKSKLTSI